MSTNIITHAAESGENSRGQLSARGGISFYHFFNISSVVCDALIQPCIEFIGTELKWSEGGQCSVPPRWSNPPHALISSNQCHKQRIQ